MPDINEEVQPTSEPTEEVQQTITPTEEVHTSEPTEPVQPSTFTEDEEEVHPLTVLHEATEAAQTSYNETVTKAKQVRDEAIASAQKQYEQSLKEYNAAIQAASRR